MEERKVTIIGYICGYMYGLCMLIIGLIYANKCEKIFLIMPNTLLLIYGAYFTMWFMVSLILKICEVNLTVPCLPSHFFTYVFYVLNILWTILMIVFCNKGSCKHNTEHESDESDEYDEKCENVYIMIVINIIFGVIMILYTYATLLSICCNYYHSCYKKNNADPVSDPETTVSI